MYQMASAIRVRFFLAQFVLIFNQSKSFVQWDMLHCFQLFDFITEVQLSTHIVSLQFDCVNSVIEPVCDYIYTGVNQVVGCGK